MFGGGHTNKTTVGDCVMELFNADRVINRDGVPEFFVHGPRMIERMPGDVMRFTFCRDQSVDPDGLLPFSMPVFIVNTPLSCMLWNNHATAQWLFQNRLLHIKPIGPTALQSVFSPLLM